MSKYGPLKQGDVKDNKIFWRYQAGGSELWLTKAKFKKYKRTMKKHASLTNESCKHKKRPLMYSQRPGDLSYYIGTSAGKERWVDFETMKNHKMVTKEARNRYIEKLKRKPFTALKVGDQHPSDQDLWVVAKYYNAVIFGTHEELTKRLEVIRERSRIKAARYKLRREKIIRNKDHSYKRGDTKDNLIFWGYNGSCSEIWLTASQFESKRQRINMLAVKANARRKQK